MIIVDTSVWIEFLKARAPYFTELRNLLEKSMIFALSQIFGELLQGVKSDSEKETVINYWNYLPKIDETELFVKAGIYSSEHNLLSKGIGLIDASIIIAAKEHDSAIWTLDKKLLNSLQKNMIFSGAG